MQFVLTRGQAGSISPRASGPGIYRDLGPRISMFLVFSSKFSFTYLFEKFAHPWVGHWGLKIQDDNYETPPRPTNFGNFIVAIILILLCQFPTSPRKASFQRWIGAAVQGNPHTYLRIVMETNQLSDEGAPGAQAVSMTPWLRSSSPPHAHYLTH